MEVNELIQIKNQIANLEETINSLKKQINGIDIDRQFYLTAEENLLPGMATKVVYNKNGLITRGDKLDKADIPNLDIDHIDGLRELINSKISKTEMSRFRSMVDQAIPRRGNITNTGIKINYDDSGYVISSSDLLEEDIPELSIDKIKGLQETLSNISVEAASAIDDEIVHPDISSNTFTKVTFDNHGHIIQGDKLDIDDIPEEILIHLNEIDSNLLSVARDATVKRISEQMNDKVDKNRPIKSGIYTKVQVDTNGLVTNGSKLTIEDLPDIEITDVKGLNTILKNKAEYSDIAETNSLASSVVEKLSKLGNLSALENDVKRKANQEDVSNIKRDLLELKGIVERTIEKVPLDMITPQFNEIINRLDNIDGRLASVEYQLNNE